MFTKFLSGNLKGLHIWEDPDLDGMDLKETGWEGVGWMHLLQEHGNEPSC
jgi:hypothetical protein